MTFGEALELMKQGEAMRRKHWGDGVHIYLSESPSDILLFKMTKNDFNCNYQISNNDMTAKNWERYE